MARERPKNPQAEHGANTDTSGATTGYEAKLWRMADALRGSKRAECLLSPRSVRCGRRIGMPNRKYIVRLSCDERKHLQ